MRWCKKITLLALLLRPAPAWQPAPCLPSHQPLRSAPAIVMAKGDGKQRRKKKEDTPPP